jgi:hypothetical protein
MFEEEKISEQNGWWVDNKKQQLRGKFSEN